MRAGELRLVFIGRREAPLSLSRPGGCGRRPLDTRVGVAANGPSSDCSKRCLLARVMPQDGTHQILQLKCPRSGIWGAAGEWGSVLTYCPDSARAGNEQTRVAEHVPKDR